MSWKRVLAAAATGLQYTLATREFQIPETPGELKKQIEIFQNPLFSQQNGCNNAQKPFLVRYDQTGIKKCASEGDLLSLRLDPSKCSTRVTLGPRIVGGCSQYNFFNRQGVSLSSFSDGDLQATEGVVAVPMHRNVPHHHRNLDNSPFIKTQLYYTSTKFLPCEMHSQYKQTVELADLKENKMVSGYCDVDPIVKKKLCWTGVGADNSTTQEKLLNGSHFYTPDPCDVMQHLPQHQSQWSVSINNPPSTQSPVHTKNIIDVKEEAFKQGCTKSGAIKLQELENKIYYHGNDDRIENDTYYADYWSSEGRGAQNTCLKANVQCIDTSGDSCDADSAECSVYNVDEYTSRGLEKCFRKDIQRKWKDTKEWWSRTITDRAYTKRPSNWEAYFKATPSKDNMNGGNACSSEITKQACIRNCYKRCKAMKFPGFSINPNTIDEESCKCSDYSMDTCPTNQKVTVGTSRESYTISPLCEDDDCDGKTRYSETLTPCQFSEDYRKRKCVETCAAENALFMTISAGGLCLCSVANAQTIIKWLI